MSEVKQIINSIVSVEVINPITEKEVMKFDGGDIDKYFEIGDTVVIRTAMFSNVLNKNDTYILKTKYSIDNVVTQDVTEISTKFNNMKLTGTNKRTNKHDSRLTNIYVFEEDN